MTADGNLTRTLREQRVKTLDSGLRRNDEIGVIASERSERGDPDFLDCFGWASQ